MAIFYILVLLCFGYVILNIVLDSKSPKEEVKTKLIDKTAESFMDVNNIINERYTLTFIVNDKTKKFDVSYFIYKKYNINDSGILIYKRNRFVDFVIDNKL